MRCVLGEWDVIVVGVRSVGDCLALLAQWPGSVVAIEVSQSNLEEAFAAICRLQRVRPPSAVMALAARGLEAAEPLLREAGAVHVMLSRQELKFAATIFKHDCQAKLNSDESIRERVWRRMPWET